MKNPYIDFENLKNSTRDLILRKFIKKIKPGRPWRSHLKIYIVRAEGFTPDQIRPTLKDQYYEEKPNLILKKFMEKYMVNVDVLSSEHHSYHLQYTNRRSKKKFHYAVFSDSKYWTVLTLVEKNDVKSTLISTISKIPNLKLLNITSRDLENLIKTRDYEKNISGFIAGYEPYKNKKDRRITISVYGGDLEDLYDIQTLFFVEPRSFKFSLTNSPEDAIAGKIFNDGYFTLEFVKKGSERYAIQTISELKNSFESINQIYEDCENYKNAPTVLEKGQGLLIESFYSLVIKIKKERIKAKHSKIHKDQTTFEIINQKIKEYFSNRNQYVFYSNSEFSHFVCDKITRSKIQIVIEPQDYSIILYPINKCSGITLREVCNGINEVEHSFESIDPFVIQ